MIKKIVLMAVIVVSGKTWGNSFAVKLPDFSLEDPIGRSHTSNALSKKGLIILVTAPILSQKIVQEKWSENLRATKKESKGQIVFLQDLSASSFKKIARKELKKDYRTEDEVLPLIDEEGKIREKLGVERKKPVVLVYDSSGKLVHQETGKPNAASAEEAWKKIK